MNLTWVQYLDMFSYFFRSYSLIGLDFHTNRQTDRRIWLCRHGLSCWLGIYIYSLWGLPHLLLSVTYIFGWNKVIIPLKPKGVGNTDKKTIFKMKKINILSNTYKLESTFHKINYSTFIRWGVIALEKTLYIIFIFDLKKKIGFIFISW